MTKKNCTGLNGTVYVAVPYDALNAWSLADVLTLLRRTYATVSVANEQGINVLILSQDTFEDATLMAEFDTLNIPILFHKYGPTNPYYVVDGAAKIAP